MGNKAKFHRPARDAEVQRLRGLKEAHGVLPRGELAKAAKDCGYSTRQLRRLLEADGTTPAEQSFTVDEEVITAVYLTCGALATAHTLLTRHGRTDLPSVRHFRRRVTAEMGTLMIQYAKKGSRAVRESRVHLTNEVEHRCHTYQMDHTELPIWVVPRGHKHPVRPWLTVAMDAKHRYPLAWVVTFGRPSAEEVAACLMQAITVRLAPDGVTPVGGRPVRVVWDRGLEFLANRVTASCMRLEILAFPLTAFSPHLKAQLERFWGTLKRGLLPTLPGYTDNVADLRGRSAIAAACLGQDEFLVKLADWMDWYIAERQHPTLGTTPLRSWAADATPLDEVPEDQLWEDFLIAKDKVKVSKMGVRFDTIDYVGELTGPVGRLVEVRYLAHDRSFIEVFLDGSHLCTAFPQGSLDEETQLRVLEHRHEQQQAARQRFTVANRVRRTSHESTQLLDFDRTGKPTVREPKAPADDLLDGAEQALDELLDRTLDTEPGQMRLL
jgi:putative transposase